MSEAVAVPIRVQRKHLSSKNFDLTFSFLKFQELKVILNNGEFEINFEPASSSAGSASASFSGSKPAAKVQVNKESQHINDEKMTDVHDKNGNIVARFYALPGGSIRMFAPQSGIQIIYDGARVKLQVSIAKLETTSPICTGASQNESCS